MAYIVRLVTSIYTHTLHLIIVKIIIYYEVYNLCIGIQFVYTHQSILPVYTYIRSVCSKKYHILWGIQFVYTGIQFVYDYTICVHTSEYLTYMQIHQIYI